MRRLSRWLWYGAAGLGLASVPLAILFLRGPANSVVAKEPESPERRETQRSRVRVETVRPQLGGIERQTTQPGSVIAFESAELYAKISGYLKTQSVDIGSRVKQDEVLDEIDAPEFNKSAEQAKAAIEQANAQVKQARARVTTSEADRDAAQAAVKQAEAEVDRTVAVRKFREKQYHRIKDLFEQKAIDERLVDEKLDEMDAARATEQAAKAGVSTAKALLSAAEAKIQQAKADLDNALANVDVAQSAFDKAQVFVDYTRIRSPYEGVVTKRNFFRGAFIRSPEQGGLVPLLGVSRTDLMRVVVQVPDRDVPFIGVGNPAKVEIDALPGDPFSGKVSRMADAEDPQTRTMRVEVDLPNPQHTLREGMYGLVTIQLNQGSKVLTVPSSCMVGDVNEGKGAVFAVRDGVARLQPVRVRTDNGVRIEILEGLKPNDEVVQRHGGVLVDGSPVDISSEKGSKQ